MLDDEKQRRKNVEEGSKKMVFEKFLKKNVFHGLNCARYLGWFGQVQSKREKFAGVCRMRSFRE